MKANLKIRIMPKYEYRLIFSEPMQIEAKNTTEFKSKIKAIKADYQSRYKNERVYIDSEIILN